MMLRKALALLGMLVVVAGCSRRDHRAHIKATDADGSIPLAPPSRPELTLLYTSDLRGRVAPDSTSANGGLSRRATMVDRVKLEGGPVLQFDAGDFLAASTDSDIPDAVYGRQRRTQIVLTSYRRMGVDAVTVGERELELGADPLKTALKAAKLTVVAANLFGRGNDRPFPADQIIDAAGTSVGVFGILDLPPDRAVDLQKWGFRTTDAGESVRATVQSLRARGARLIVGLFHVTGGRERVKAILTQAGDAHVDVVVLGHGGDDLAAGPATTVGRTRVVRTGSRGTDLGRLDVRASPPGVAPGFTDQALALTNTISDHPGVALIERAEIERVRSAQEQSAAALRRKRGQKAPEVVENWNYASNDSCVMCHKAEWEQWRTTDHAQARATLEKGKHERDPACLGCHMTGYLQPGGTRNLQTAATFFANVGCESCHGPSAVHVRAINRKMGTSRAAGPGVCLGCHTADQNLGPFEYAAALKAILGPGHGALAAKSSAP